MEEDGGIINVGGGGGFGTIAIITRIMVEGALFSSGMEVSKEFFEENGEAKGSKDRAKGTTLGHTLLLLEGSKVTITIKEVALSGLAIQEIKEGEE